MTRMAELYADGATVERVAAAMGVTAPTVSRRLRAAGVAMRPGGVRLPVTDRQILDLRLQGLLWREVAAAVGMTRPGVHARYCRIRDAEQRSLPTTSNPAG